MVKLRRRATVFPAKTGTDVDDDMSDFHVSGTDSEDKDFRNVDTGSDSDVVSDFESETGAQTPTTNVDSSPSSVSDVEPTVATARAKTKRKPGRPSATATAAANIRRRPKTSDPHVKFPYISSKYSFLLFLDPVSTSRLF